MKDNNDLPVLEVRLQKDVQQAMIREAQKEAADFYEQWVSMLEQHILTKTNSPHPDAMPPGVRQAIMLGTIQAAITANISLMKPETQKWAIKALKDGLDCLDLTSLMGGLGIDQAH